MSNIIRLLLALMFISLFWQNGFAAETQDSALLEQANNAYHEGNFSVAASLYEQLITENGYSAALLYNLANTYAQNGETGKAIVSYQRAKLLDPGDPDIQGNLEAVNKKAGLFDKESPFLNKLTNLLTFNQWCIFSLGCFTIFVAASAGALFLPGWKGLSKTAAPIALILAVISLFPALASYHPYTSGVIVKPETTLLISPHDKAAANGSLREGRLVNLVKEYKNFCYIEDSSGRTGWVNKQAVEAIIPPAL